MVMLDDAEIGFHGDCLTDLDNKTPWSSSSKIFRKNRTLEKECFFEKMCH